MTARVVLLVTSPRLPAGLLTAAAWDIVRAAPTLAGEESELTVALRAAGVEVRLVGAGAMDALLAGAAEHGTAVWLAGPAGDQALARELGLRLAREPGRAELELMYGSWDPPGARLLDAVAVLDRLVSPGGDPWKREQTHHTLARYLLEECYEAYDAIATGDLGALRDELGDVLLQVVLHARLAEELPESERWTVDDVAGGLVDKMIRRNPHVFADATVKTVEEITANWERIKQAERPRESVLDGIATGQPALALATKILERTARAGLAVPLPEPQPGVQAGPGAGSEPGPEPAAGSPQDRLGAELLALVARAHEAGLDPELALRTATSRYADAVRVAERGDVPRR
ncbi:nucleoside triphosphate pyrophosphohydrolase [Plantactinospora sp. GCM10030261]|uniref:nucleoside triphosphate pyrophosphohydrolase n=1 Tax=Plantactinospora sp. GCM10030261 TaxID=3273420 RepID=UPI003606C7FA